MDLVEDTFDHENMDLVVDSFEKRNKDLVEDIQIPAHVEMELYTVKKDR